MRTKALPERVRAIYMRTPSPVAWAQSPATLHRYLGKLVLHKSTKRQPAGPGASVPRSGASSKQLVTGAAESPPDEVVVRLGEEVGERVSHLPSGARSAGVVEKLVQLRLSWPALGKARRRRRTLVLRAAVTGMAAARDFTASAG